MEISNARISAALARVRERDPGLGRELARRLDEGAARPTAAGAVQFESDLREAAPAMSGGVTLETIVLRTGRPVLAISRNEVDVQIAEAESQVWRERLAAAKPHLQNPILAVGRIELAGHPDFAWVGTGWLIRPDVVVTNRHVGQAFGRRSGEGFVFRTGLGQKPIGVSIDFLEEVGRPEERSFELREILHIEEDDGPDLAFLRIEGRDLAPPIRLAGIAARELQQVAVIGYPARDSRIPDLDLMDRLFGDVYDKKRLAPGQISLAAGNDLQHDCSTLGGNSGSVVLDLATGEAVGIHFAGRFLQANYAVPATVIEERLQAARTHELRPAPRPAAASSAGAAPQAPVQAGSRIELTIPIKLTVEVGGAVTSVQATAVTAPAIRPVPAPPSDAGDDDIAVEGVPADYLDRRGYRADFLGGGLVVPMPEIVSARDQVVSFEFAGNPQETVLRYHNFSVTMHRSRRQCFFSAVNIDGNLSRKTKRKGWLMDPRLPRELQIMKECYGDAPRFSRGHMTRREDPAWGSVADAQRGNADSMHVTNAVPQMQTFNGGVWLGLEDYALENAREDDMKICVLTGPIFAAADPEMFGVRIPVQFWKVIAFVHDSTGKLSATGYSMSQKDFLREEEFVFGAYRTNQRSLRWIEQQAGLSFGPLTALDRFEDIEEALSAPLASFRQIRF